MTIYMALFAVAQTPETRYVPRGGGDGGFIAFVFCCLLAISGTVGVWSKDSLFNRDTYLSNLVKSLLTVLLWMLPVLTLVLAAHGIL